MAASRGERALALELTGVVGLTTLSAFRQGAMPGPSSYVGAFIVFGMLAALGAYEPASDLAAALGFLALLAVLLRPTTDKAGRPSTMGGENFRTLARWSHWYSQTPAPVAQGIQGAGGPQSAGASSSGPSAGSSSSHPGGLFNPLNW